MKFKEKTKDCHLVVRVKTSIGEKVDAKELERFARICLRGFLKPKMIKKNLIEYTGPIGISLNERLKKPISKRDFLFVMEQIVVAIQKLQANNMALNSMIMSVQNAYINEITKEVQFIYLPIVEPKNAANVMELFEAIIYSTQPANEKDSDFVSHFVYFLKGLKKFDVVKIEEYIAREDKSIVNTIKKQNAGQSGFMTDKPQHYYEHYDQKADGSEEDTALLNDESNEATGLLEDEDATGLLNNTDEEEDTGLLCDYAEDEEDTALLNGSYTHYPTLFRVLTEETISVDKPVFRLGKEQSYVDYFISNNVAISRSHADIITRSGRCFIKDLNSRNRSYINEKELPASTEIEICDGDRLRLANEEFVFHM